MKQKIKERMTEPKKERGIEDLYTGIKGQLQERKHAKQRQVTKKESTVERKKTRRKTRK